jgi:hypothetical protein
LPGALSASAQRAEARRICRASVTGGERHQDPAGSPDRFFIPLATPEIWLRQGDVKIYSCEAADSTCVAPSA